MPQFITYLGGGSTSSVVASSNPETTEPLTYYVATTGNDTNPGTSGQPFLTIQKAVDILPKNIKHTVIINIDVGTFTGFNLEGFNISTMGVDTLGLYINGTLITSSLTSGLTSGIVASATAGTNDSVTWGTATITGAGWTNDDLRGRFIRIDSGTGVGQIRSIASNTATVITVAGNWTAPTGATFTIVEPGTIINAAFNAGQLGGTNVYIQGCQGGTELGFIPDRKAIHISKIKFTGGRGIRITAAVRARFDNLVFNNTTTGLVLANNGGWNEVVNSVFVGGVSGLEVDDAILAVTSRNVFLDCGTGFLLSSSGLTLTTMSSNVTSNMNFYRACTTRAIFSTGVMSMAGDIINAVTPGSRVGILVSGIAGFARINTCSISNCATAIQATGGNNASYISLIGVVSSPTTVFNDGPGAGNTTAILVTKGIAVQISSTTTLTGTTELSIDSSAQTLATMRAQVPKALLDSNFGTKVYE